VKFSKALAALSSLSLGVSATMAWGGGFQPVRPAERQPAYSYNYRLIVVAQVDGKEVRGNGLVTVDYFAPTTLSQTGGMDRAYGKAPLVDLGRYGVLLAALRLHPVAARLRPKPVPATKLAYAAIYGSGETKAQRDDHLAEKTEIQAQKGRFPLAMEMYPSLIWLSDPKNITSAKLLLAPEVPQQIDPAIKIVSISVEMTGEKPGEVDYPELPWFRELRDDEEKNGTSNRNDHYHMTALQLRGYLWHRH
jgi:hypothetical protein